MKKQDFKKRLTKPVNKTKIQLSDWPRPIFLL